MKENKTAKLKEHTQGWWAMNKIELVKVYAFAGAIWSSFKTPTNDTEARLFDEVWFGILRPYPLEMVLSAIQEYATENDFCNIAKIGDLCKKYTEKANGTYIDIEKELMEIKDAVSYANCKENFANLSPFAQSIVRHPAYLAQWSQNSQFETVIMSNLRKQMTNILAEKKHDEIMQLTSENKKLLN